MSQLSLQKRTCPFSDEAIKKPKSERKVSFSSDTVFHMKKKKKPKKTKLLMEANICLLDKESQKPLWEVALDQDFEMTKLRFSKFFENFKPEAQKQLRCLGGNMAIIASNKVIPPPPIFVMDFWNPKNEKLVFTKFGPDDTDEARKYPFIYQDWNPVQKIKERLNNEEKDFLRLYGFSEARVMVTQSSLSLRKASRKGVKDLKEEIEYIKSVFVELFEGGNGGLTSLPSENFLN